MQSLYDIWFDNPRFWFSATDADNDYLKANFRKWINKYSNCEETIKNFITIIILYDQIPRNINMRQDAYDIIAKHYAYKLRAISNNYKELSAIEWCFAMLPFRHSNNVELIHEVIENTWKRIYNSLNQNDIQIYKKYLRVSYEKCPYSNDMVKGIYPINNIWDATKYKNILEYAPYDIPILKINNDKIVNGFIDILKQEKPKNVIISLSGGVDSMICSVILHELQSEYKYNLCGVHINYTNRDSCADEEKMLEDWCGFLNIPLYIRRLSEIKRSDCMKYELRSTYESYTQKMRFMTYKYVNENSNSNSNSMPFVILGHNYDDVTENILTNIAQKTKYDNLAGMEKISIRDEIKFVRPMLEISKVEIYNFSKIYNIPHLVTSTPVWSMRGKIRDIVKPALLKLNTNIMSSLVTLSDAVKDMSVILDKHIDKTISETKFDENSYKIIIPLCDLLSKKIFWQKYINKLTKQQISLQCSIFLEEKIERFKCDAKIKIMKISLSKSMRIYFTKEADSCEIKICMFCVDGKKTQ